MGDNGPRDYKIRMINACQGSFEIMLNSHDAEELALSPLDRILLKIDQRELVAIINVTDTMIEPGEVGLFCEAWDALAPEEGQNARIIPINRPRSVEFIRKKIQGQPLNAEEIRELVANIVSGRLSPLEITAFSVAVQILGLSMDEVVDLTKAMVETGERINFSRHPVLDVHSIGGVPGNKYAAITVPIVAASGLVIPKTSSRAISSACGTADFMEVITEIAHGGDAIVDIAERVGGTLVWGGGVNVAPADDIIIRTERPLSLDPHGQVLASVMAKKIATGVDKLLIDLPMGVGTKVETHDEAKRLARDFIELGRRLDIEVRCAITYGGQPIGRTIGPKLEVREALQVLEGAEKPRSIYEKSLELAGILLEMGSVSPLGRGRFRAEEVLRSGKALEKFREIIQAQGGNGDISSDDIQPGRFSEEMLSTREGYVEEVRNRSLVRIARTAGSPKDKGAGVMIHKKEGETIDRDEPLLTIYADTQWKLDSAVSLAMSERPMRIEGMILEEVVD